MKETICLGLDLRPMISPISTQSCSSSRDFFSFCFTVLPVPHYNTVEGKPDASMKGKKVAEMAGGTEEEAETQERQSQRDGCSFVWDDATQLYFHASSGFYHDPSAGWYYSSRDGLYYKFENGSYVLLEYNDKADVSDLEAHCCGEMVTSNAVSQDSSWKDSDCGSDGNLSYLPTDKDDTLESIESDHDDKTPGHMGCSKSTKNPPPPSEWLEETLINLYLSGYKQAADCSTMPMQMDVDDDNVPDLGEGDLNNKSNCASAIAGQSIADEDVSKDEENWQAQYGQVIYPKERLVTNIPAVDLWDWAMVSHPGKDGKGRVARVVGRLVKPSAKLHPSMTPSGGLFRTAPICEVFLDLVRVRTGKVYKLHNPSASYLASLSSYDSSDPTKDWGFPEFSTNVQDIPLGSCSRKIKTTDSNTDCNSISMLPDQQPIPTKEMTHTYRDRAAERRTLHGGFGVGPGQKGSLVGDVSGTLSSLSCSTEEAAAEALDMSFGAGSYGRKILEGMGWKEGESLGKTTEGIVEPVQAVGNVGNTGLGWPQRRT